MMGFFLGVPDPDSESLYVCEVWISEGGLVIDQVPKDRTICDFIGYDLDVLQTCIEEDDLHVGPVSADLRSGKEALAYLAAVRAGDNSGDLE